MHASDRPFDALVTHRLNGFSSGVARFNQILAEQIDAPLRFLFDPELPLDGRALLSFKVTELDDAERARLDALLDRARWQSTVFLHDWGGSALEERLVRDAERVLCGNHEIEQMVAALNPQREVVWSPGLILDARLFEPSRISVFSFGMAHKLRTDMFRRLRELLDESKQTYALYVSTANHETASIGDAQLVYDEMEAVFHRNLYFLGNLSDVAVYNYLSECTFFATFFKGGVRANNGSVAAAMEHGAVVITNLDEHSPPDLVHLDNVIDINQCDRRPIDPFLLRRIGVRAAETARSRGWDQLVDRLVEPDRKLAVRL